MKTPDAPHAQEEEKEVKKSLFVKSTGWIASGVILSILLAAAAAWANVSLVQLDLLPARYLFAVVVILWLLILAGIVLQFFSVTRIASKVVAAVELAALLALIVASNSTADVLDAASDITTTVDSIHIYVLEEDPAETITDTIAYPYGILGDLDRSNTDEALAAVEEELGATLDITEYDSIEALAQALLDQEVSAILVNSAYLTLLEEDESLSDFSGQIRMLSNYEIERELEIAAEEEEEEEEDTEEEETAEEDEETLEPLLVYISGNDAYGTLSSTGRSDVNIIMAVNFATHKILLANTPRDYYVELSNVSGAYDKLTHAGIYGVDVSMNTLANLYDITIEYYIRMNFTGFVEIIDALGGITVESTVAFSTSSGYSYVVGENELDGAAALAFARERYSFSTGDRQRGINQMTVISAVIEKLYSPAILTGYLDILEAASGSFETNLTSEQLAELVRYQLDYGGSWEVETISADGSNGSGKVYSSGNASAYIMIPDDDSVAEVSAQLKAILEETAEDEAEDASDSAD